MDRLEGRTYSEHGKAVSTSFNDMVEKSEVGIETICNAPKDLVRLLEC